MKLPKITKLPSGSYRAQVTINGQRRSVTGADKQSVQEAVMRLKLGENTERGTIKELAERYIKDREGVLSPSTILRYRQFLNSFPELTRMRLSAVNDSICQRAISNASKALSPKTIQNLWGFYKSVFKQNGREFHVRLPEVQRNEHPFLDQDQLKQFLEAIKGTSREIGILLGLHGLRKSEILGLTWDDIDLEKRELHVRKSLVRGTDGIVTKDTLKNAGSRRTVPIMIPRLYDLLESVEPKKGNVVPCGLNSLYESVNRICEREGLPLIGVHGLRHTFASICYANGISELACMKLGGWNDFGTMRRIYTHLAESEIRSAADKLEQFFS